ncbi:hypothetical protein HK102_003673 [Quaeritorhiza haematococci]|nr:hypothetical protein HK102_003673 [Quaeritorhiza haematococci]
MKAIEKKRADSLPLSHQEDTADSEAGDTSAPAAVAAAAETTAALGSNSHLVQQNVVVNVEAPHGHVQSDPPVLPAYLRKISEDSWGHLVKGINCFEPEKSDIDAAARALADDLLGPNFLPTEELLDQFFPSHGTRGAALEAFTTFRASLEELGKAQLQKRVTELKAEREALRQKYISDESIETQIKFFREIYGDGAYAFARFGDDRLEPHNIQLTIETLWRLTEFDQYSALLFKRKGPCTNTASAETTTAAETEGAFNEEAEMEEPTQYDDAANVEWDSNAAGGSNDITTTAQQPERGGRRGGSRRKRRRRR